MKCRRIGMVLAFVVLAALMGCASAPEEEPPASKGTVIEKLDSSGEREFLMEDPEAVNAFIDTYFNYPYEYVSGDADTPDVDGLAVACRYVIWQDETIRAGQTEPPGMECVMAFTLYEDSNAMTMEILPDGTQWADGTVGAWIGNLLCVTCEADAQTVSYLKGYDGT